MTCQLCLPFLYTPVLVPAALEAQWTGEVQAVSLALVPGLNGELKK
jgi:hypothetical protein